MKKIIVFVVSLAFFSCAPIISTQITSSKTPLKENASVNVFDENESFPKSAIVLGTLKIGDSGFTVNCSYDVVVEKAKDEARKVGGNAIKIISHDFPSPFGSSCHRIKAQILDVNENEMAKLLDNKNTVIAKNDNSNVDNSISKGPINSSKVFATASIGAAFRTAKVQSSGNAGLDKNTENTKNGMSYDIAVYYAKRQTGFGLKYNVFSAKSTDYVSNFSTDSGPFSADFTQDVSISFIGPSMVSMSNSNKSKIGEANLEIAMGYMWYKNVLSINNQKFCTVNGASFGMLMGGGYRFKLSKTILVGPQIAYSLGTLTKLNYVYYDGSKKTEKLGENNAESLSNLQLSLSAKIKF